MADPFNLVTQYERQLAGVGEASRAFPAAFQSGFAMGSQRRSQRAQERLLNEQIRGLETQNSINEQLLQNPAKLVDDFGDLKTTEERLQFLAKNAGIAATPAGAKVLQQLEGIADSMARREVNSIEYQAKAGAAKRAAEIAIKHGVDPSDPVAMKSAMRAESAEQFLKLLSDNDRQPAPNLITDDLFDESDRLNMGVALARIEEAPLKESLQLQRERLDAEIDARSNPKPDKPPAAIQEADLITELQEKIASTADPSEKARLQRRLENIQVQTAPSGMEITTADGTVIRQGKGVGSGGKETEAQSNARIYASRMRESEDIFSELGSEGFDPTSWFSGAGSLLPNKTQTEEVQRFTAAANNFISAVLRKESGASISPAERESAWKEYIPRFGDTAGTLKDKAARRRNYIKQMAKTGGIADSGGGANASESVLTFNSEAEAKAANPPVGSKVRYYDQSLAKWVTSIVEP